MILSMWWMLVFVIRLPSLVVAVCDGNQFACKDGHECVAAKQHCDHVIDCSDGSDEIECSYPCRSPHMKRCKDGHCIAMFFFCDRENDCGDWSDELDCTGMSSSLALNCPSNTFHCEGQVCIPQNWVCDGMVDCSDARDELHCNITKECKNGFQCGKECILNQWVCDGVTDCADGSDEKECGSEAFMNHSCLPEHGWFSCLSKGTQKCMPISRACDGYADCDDRTDEGGQCNSTTNCSNSTRCPNECHKTPRGPICSCPSGYQLNGTTCVDIDECSMDPPMCSQKCANNQGGFECSCSSGYTVGTRNNGSCVANGPDPMLLITTDRDIRYISPPSIEYGLVVSGISQARGVAADYEDGVVYWNEKSKDKAGIYKSMLDGSAFQYVVSVGVEIVEDLAIDWVGRHIYFADSGRKHIVVCDFNAAICSVVISGQLDKPRAVAVYPEEGLLFWSDWGSSPHIGSAGMDGSKRTNVITTDIVWPNGLVVDETIQRIYWGDAKLNRIESSRIDGSDRKILPVKVTHPYALDIFENTIFWCDPLEHEVLSVNKFTGKDYKILMKEASLTPTGIHVHHPSKQNHLTNPCRNVICSHLCLLSPSVQGYKCACPVGMTLNKDSRTCESISAHESSIVIATYTDIYRLTHHQIGKDSIFRLPTRNVENIGALAYNPLGHSIVYSDMIQRTIYSMHLDTYRQTVLFENVDMVEGLDVDPFTENIYWTEVTRGTVVVGQKNHDGVYERLVLARNLYSPQGITIGSQSGRMFIVEGRISHVISVWHMDGTNRQELVEVHGIVSAMAYDGKHLYFSDSLRGSIERIEVNGENRIILRSHLGTPVALDVSADSVFWLAQSSTRISWLNKQDPKTMRGFVIDASENITVQYRLMAVIDLFDSNSHAHHCLGDTGGCSDICAPTPDGVTCLCPLGKVLGEDKHVCTKADCVGDEWFKCQASCIPAKFRCDGVNDCALGEDELQCRNTTTEVGCTSSQFQCKNGGCVSIHLYCDGDADCQDRSDEPDSCPPYVCKREGEYSCPNQRHCIPRSAVCDGNEDCNDKSDEANCTSTHSVCSSTQFYCSNSHTCIPLSWVCDRDSDCQDGEDEDSSVCGNVDRKLICPLNYLRCPQHSACMPRKTLCNSIAGCEHLTNEELCAKLNDLIVDKMKPEKPKNSSVSCPRYFFQCRPDLKCHSRKLVCAGDAACRKLSVKSLCERLKRNETSRAYTQTSEALREVSSSTTTPKLTTQHALHHSSDFSNAMPSFEASSIRLPSQVGQVVAEDIFSQIEETLQAVLDGPVHVLSRLFTRKGHNIDFATIFSMDKTPVPINPVWDSFTNKTRFVEDLKIQNGNRLVLWKIFRPQAYSSDGNLRTVHHMELRTLKKMGFTFIVIINLASWIELSEAEKILFVTQQLDLVLLNSVPSPQCSLLVIIKLRQNQLKTFEFVNCVFSKERHFKMTPTPENNSVPRQRSSQENVNGNDGLPLPNEDGNNSLNSIKRLSNDQFSDKDDMRMKRQVGLFSGVTLIVGTMIGSGIFVSAGSLLANAGSPGLCLVLWGVCGVYSLLGAIAYCEIGTLIPKSGGEYIYFLEAFGPTHKFFGPILAFIFAWVTVFLINPSSVAILSLSFAKYLSSPILTAVNFCPDEYLTYVLDRLLATICIGAITFVNCYSVKGATHVQNIFTVGKLTAIAIIIGGGLYYLGLGYTENLEIGFEGSASSFGQIATAFYGGLWAYSGWNNLNFITEELKNPYRNLPLAIIIALPLTTICYVLINVSYLTVLTPQQIISSDVVAVDWGDAVLGSASFLIPLGVVISVMGTTNGTLFAAGRISHVVGREGQSPDFLSYIHFERKTPIAPILLTSLLGIFMIIPGDIATLIDFFGFAISIFYCAAMVALIVMRFTKKDEHRPIKVPIIIPVIVMVVSAILVVAPIAAAPQVQYFYVLLFIFAGLIFYIPFVYYKKSLPGISFITIFFQKLFQIVPTSHEFEER